MLKIVSSYELPYIMSESLTNSLLISTKLRLSARFQFILDISISNLPAIILMELHVPLVGKRLIAGYLLGLHSSVKTRFSPVNVTS